MPWSYRILVRHHRTEKFQRHCSDLMPKLFLKCMPRCAIGAIGEFCIFVSSKLTFEANFPTLKICKKSMKVQNGLKFPSELCFGIMNATKDSNLLNSKVKLLKGGQNAAGNCPFYARHLGL